MAKTLEHTSSLVEGSEHAWTMLTLLEFFDHVSDAHDCQVPRLHGLRHDAHLLEKLHRQGHDLVDESLQLLNVIVFLDKYLNNIFVVSILFDLVILFVSNFKH